MSDKEKTVDAHSRILKPQGVLAVSHFDSSEGINRHHGSCHAVMHDHLPDERTMRDLLQTAGLVIDLFIDKSDFYCILASK